MSFNTSKFDVRRFGRNLDIKKNTNYLTPEAEELIEGNEVLRYLGAIVNDKATFDDHVDKVCAKVKQKEGWELRISKCRTTWFMKLMWNTLIQGHIDYCSQLYQPVRSRKLQRIEDLQKTYTKKIPEI